MINHKVLHILKSFSHKELKSFRDFVNSPFFNKSEKVFILLERLIKDYPVFSFECSTNETIHNEIFPRIKFNDATMRHLFSDLYTLAEKFLIEINMDSKETERNGCLLEELYSRDLIFLMESTLNKTEDFYKNNKEGGGTIFLNRFRHETDKFNYYSSRPDSFSNKNIESIIHILNNRNKCLIGFFITELIKCTDTINLIAEKNNYQPSEKFTKHLLKTVDIEKVLKGIKDHKELSEFKNVLNTYYNLYKVLNNPDSEAFYFELKKEIKENKDKYSFDELAYLYKKLVDYCIKKSKMKNATADFNKELFEVYEEILRGKLYLNYHTMSFPVDLFRNILILALRIKNYEWADYFIYFYSDQLPAEQKINVLNFSLASLFFEKMEYEKSLHYLDKIKLNNISIKLDCKNLLMKIYFEVNFQDSLISLIATYREFLRKTEGISEAKRESHRSFIKFTERLCMLKLSDDRSELLKLKSDILAISPLVNKVWLIEKVDSAISDLSQESKYRKLV